MTLRSPVILTTSMRFDLGPTRERQNVEQQVGSGRNRPGNRMTEQFWRSSGPNNVSNPMSTILRQQDTLKLTAQQADSIAVLNRRYTYRADSLWAPVARHLGSLGQRYDIDAAYDMFIRARRAQVDMLMRIAPNVISLLTPEQRRKLPLQVVNALDPRYLLSIRNGTNTFVSGGGPGASPFISFGSGEFVRFSP